MKTLTQAQIQNYVAVYGENWLKEVKRISRPWNGDGFMMTEQSWKELQELCDASILKALSELNKEVQPANFTCCG
jgi:hypothetical protein